jgi:hypothetical protein
LPREELVALARRMRRPLCEIEGLVSYYPHLRVEPPPRVAVHACRDLSCWLAGSAPGLADRYGSDVEFREVSCLGRCDMAPAVTLMNSVETFADVPVIVQRGAQWWIDAGLGESVGWTFFAVSGHVDNPGVYCVPMGTTARALLVEAAGAAQLIELEYAMRKTSICGLGQVALGPVSSVLTLPASS